MQYDQDGLLIGFSFSSFFKINVPKNLIGPDRADSHQEEYAAEAFIASFGDVSPSFPLAGFIDRGIDTSISDDFLMRREVSISYFSQEVGRSDFVDSWDRLQDLHRRKGFFSTVVEEDVRDLSQLILKEKEDTDFCFQDIFAGWRDKTDGLFSYGDEALRGGGGFSSFLTRAEAVQDLQRGGQSEGFFGGEGQEEFERGGGKGVKEFKKLREEDVEESFDFRLKRGDLLGDRFSFSGENSEVIERLAFFLDGLSVGSKEFSNGGGVLFIGFGLTQREFGEIGDEQRVEELNVKAAGLKEGEQIEVIGAGGFHAEKKVLKRRAMRAKGEEEGTKALRGHGEKKGEEGFRLVVDQGGVEGIFRDIDPTKKSKHEFTSSGIIWPEAGGASRSILHSDEGSRTQSTSQDIGRQGTDSLKGSKTQEIWSSPASFLPLSYQASNYPYNINY